MAYDSTKKLFEPLAAFSEEEVIPFFAHDSAGLNKGTFVKVTGDGWKGVDASATLDGINDFGGDVGASYNGVISQRYGAVPKVTTAGTGDANKVVGMILKDVRETDENDIPLRYNPTKKEELQAVISGETNPILKRGLVRYYATGVAAGDLAYIDGNGEIDINSDNTHSAVQVGKFLGSSDDDNYALLAIEL